MYCINCGTKLDDNSRFCHSCGQRVENLEIEKEVLKKKKKKKKAPIIAVVILVICLIAGGGGGFYFFQKNQSPEKKVEKAISLIENGEYEKGLELISDINTEQATQLKKYCNVESVKKTYLEQFSNLTSDKMQNGTIDADDVFFADGSFMDVIFNIFFEREQLNEYALIPDTLKSNLIYYCLICEMMEDGFEIPPGITEEEVNAYRNGPLSELIAAIANYYVEDNQSYDAWGLNPKTVMEEALVKFKDTMVLDVYSEELNNLLKDNISTEEGLRVVLDINTRDVGYYLLTGKTIDEANDRRN